MARIQYSDHIEDIIWKFPDLNGFLMSKGMNCIVCGDLFPGIGDLAGGVYVYRIALYPSSGPMERRTGRFAVVR